MKNRRIAIIAFVLVAVMAIGVGYAAISDQLGITATLGANSGANFEDNVHWSDAAAVITASGDSSKVSAEAGAGTVDAVPYDEKDLLTVEVDNGALVNKDDTVVIKKNIVNDSDLDATVAVDVDEKSNTNFKVNVALSNANLAAGGEVTVTITITLVEASIDDMTGSFNFVITATAVNP